MTTVMVHTARNKEAKRVAESRAQIGKIAVVALFIADKGNTVG